MRMSNKDIIKEIQALKSIIQSQVSPNQMITEGLGLLAVIAVELRAVRLLLEEIGEKTE